jgi:hypothetical protein
MKSLFFFALAVLAAVLLLVELLQRYTHAPAASAGVIATREPRRKTTSLVVCSPGEPERGEWCDLDYDYEIAEPAADCAEKSIDDYLRWLLK